MANTVNIKLNLNDDGSINAASERVKGLNRELAQSKKLAAAGFMQEGEGQSYGIARGAVGTGAAGRDFAKQAQGLGGLVHVYATFAANLFAVGAAFRALSEAADTTNMVRGMDQLGASSGQALGSIAKRLVETTDSAISMRDAMEATAKGTSAGMTSKQMTQMAEVAKKASQALGISMPDALSRLSRGISKIEPELLDELGIFTKVEKATTDYARTIGKTATQLTDFEKRQAFANAVIKEGLDKFSAIDMAANPYDKLLASLKNVGQQGLEVANKLLGPLVAFLSASPTALMAVLAGIGTILLKQAIPALGQFTQNIKNTAEASRLAFAKVYLDQQNALGDLAGKNAVAAEAAFRASATTAQKVKALSQDASQFQATAKKDWAALAAKNPFEMTPEEIKSLENRARTLDKSNKDQADSLRKHVQTIKGLRADLVSAGNIAQEAVEKGTSGIGTTAGQNELIYQRQLQQASRDGIKSRIAEVQSTYGMRAAFRELGVELNKAKAGMLEVKVGVDDTGNAIMAKVPAIGKLGAAYTGLTATLGIVGTKLGKTLEAFSPWLVGLGLAIEAFSLFDGWMSSNAREMDAFNKSLDNSRDSIDNVKRTLDTLSNKGGAAFNTIQATVAMSNAFANLTSAMDDSMQAAKLAKNAMGTWDKIKDGFFSWFGGGIDKNLAKTIGLQIDSAIDILRKAGRSDKFEATIKNILNVDSLDLESVTKAFSKLSDTAKKELQTALSNVNMELAASASKLSAFKSATENVTKAYQEFIQSTANTNPLFKLGTELQNLGKTMSEVFTGGVDDINKAFTELAKNPDKAVLFGDKFVNQLVDIRQGYLDQADAVGAYTSRLQDLNKQVETNKGIMPEYDSGKPLSAAARKYNPKLKAAEQTVKDAEYLKTELDLLPKDKMQSAANIFREGMDQALKKGAEYIATALGQAAEKAGLILEKSRSGVLSGKLAATAEGQIAQRELDIQMKAIDTNIDLINSQEKLTAAINLSNANYALKEAIDQKKPTDRLEQAQQAAQIFRDYLEKGGKGKIDYEAMGGASPDVINMVKAQQLAREQRIAPQLASKTLVGAEKQAKGEETTRKERAGELADREKLLNLNGSIVAQDIARLNIAQKLSNNTSEDILKQVQSLETRDLINKQSLELDKIDQSILNAQEQKGAKYEEEVKKLQQQRALIVERQIYELDNRGEQNRVALQEMELKNYQKAIDFELQLEAFRNKNRDLAFSLAQGILSEEQAILKIKQDQGTVSQQEYLDQSRALEGAQMALENSKKLSDLDKQRAIELADLQKKMESAAGDEKEQERLTILKGKTEDYYTTAITNEKTLYDLKLQTKALNDSLNARQIAYADVFKKSFDGMADAIVKFAETGKLSFKDLINTMLSDLLRYELRLQTSAMWSAIRPSVLGWFSGGNGAGNTMHEQGLNQLAPQAKGGVWDAGIQMFGKGGSFTNGIVNSPTLFKFAQGTGLMGEAGPEAIMPLKRDGQGNLGVRANSQKTEVVVNNYGNDKATATETVDSRGNRRIEVTVGDMTAGELSRSGSGPQKAMRNTYGIQPKLIRR